MADPKDIDKWMRETFGVSEKNLALKTALATLLPAANAVIATVGAVGAAATRTIDGKKVAAGGRQQRASASDAKAAAKEPTSSGQPRPEGLVKPGGPTARALAGGVKPSAAAAGAPPSILSTKPSILDTKPSILVVKPAAKANQSRSDSGQSSSGAENELQLRFEQKNLQDKLKAPRSYPGREADEARLEQIDAKLGAKSSRAPVQPPKDPDPRVAELAKETRSELKLTPRYGDLVDQKVNGHMIEEYQELRQALSAYLDNIDVQNSTSKDLGDRVMKDWARTIYDAGELRQMLAGNLAGQYSHSIADEQKRLQDLNKDLKDLIEKNKLVAEEFKRLQDVEDAIKVANILLDVNDMAEAVGDQVGEVERVAGFGKAGVGLFNTATRLSMSNNFTKAGDQIEHKVESVAKYSFQVAVQYQGFANLKDLETAILRKVEAIRDSVKKIDQLSSDRDQEQGRSDKGASEAPKK